MLYKRNVTYSCFIPCSILNNSLIFHLFSCAFYFHLLCLFASVSMSLHCHRHTIIIKKRFKALYHYKYINFKNEIVALCTRDIQCNSHFQCHIHTTLPVLKPIHYYILSLEKHTNNHSDYTFLSDLFKTKIALVLHHISLPYITLHKS